MIKKYIVGILSLLLIFTLFSSSCIESNNSNQPETEKQKKSYPVELNITISLNSIVNFKIYIPVPIKSARTYTVENEGEPIDVLNNVQNIKGNGSHTIAKANRSYLFSLDIGYSTYLKEGNISEELYNAFKQNNLLLPINSTLNQTEEYKWDIISSEKEYNIKIIQNLDEMRLKIYNFAPPDIASDSGNQTYYLIVESNETIELSAYSETSEGNNFYLLSCKEIYAKISGNHTLFFNYYVCQRGYNRMFGFEVNQEIINGWNIIQFDHIGFIADGEDMIQTKEENEKNVYWKIYIIAIILLIATVAVVGYWVKKYT